MEASWNELVFKGRNGQALLYGAGTLAAAGGIAYLGVIGWTLTIRRFALPTWSMFVAAGIVGLIGVAFFLFSESEKCKRCGQVVERIPAYFPLEAEMQVVLAVQAGDPSGLLTLPPVPKNQMKMHLDIAGCTGCGQIARIDLTKWQDFQPHTLAENVIVQGQPAEVFRQVARSHAEWRGDDEDE